MRWTRCPRVPPMSFEPLSPPHRAIALAAGALPPLVAFNLSPSATMINQCAALALWGWWVVALAPHRLPRGVWPLTLAIALIGSAAAWSTFAGTLPLSIGLSALGLLGGAMLLTVAGAVTAQREDAAAVLAAFADGLLACAVLSAGVAVAQVFAPDFGSPDLIARSGIACRAVGNVRQPNQLCSLLQWGLIAVGLGLQQRRLPTPWAWILAALLVFAVELSGSRTGAAGLALLALWGLVDRRLSAPARRLLLAVPLLFAIAYAAMAGYGHWSHQTVGAATRLEEAGGIESPNARTNIWRNAVTMIGQQPWTGVGFGEFNFAWTLTAFPARPTAFFDHTHTLPLQLAVELGLPLSALILGLLVLALWRAWYASEAACAELRPAARAAVLMVATIGVHSLVEYPLWYAYFLLPAAYAWGFALGANPGTAPARAVSPTIATAAGVVLAAGGVYASIDYVRVAEIYVPGENSDALEVRIARGQRSLFFAHHADYAAATSGGPGPGADLGFARATHNLLDTRLMSAWARHLADGGHVDLARALAGRLRDFRNPDAEAFFAPCTDPPSAEPRPFQCEPASSLHGWREYQALTREH